MPIKKLKATQKKPKSSDNDIDIVVQADKVQTEKPREAGPVHVGHHIQLKDRCCHYIVATRQSYCNEMFGAGTS